MASSRVLHAEPEALKHSFSYLVNSIDTAALLPVALSKNLITDRQRTECYNEADPYKKAETFVGYLQRAVNGDCYKFYTFVQILQETDQTQIASRLRDELAHSFRSMQQPSASSSTDEDPFLQLQVPPEHNPRRLRPLEKSPKQSDLLNKVAAKASDKWKKMGQQLEIEYHKLKTISRENPEDSLDCYAEMFELWRKCGSPPYTWATIIDALRADIVGEISLADDLEQWVINKYA